MAAWKAIVSGSSLRAAAVEHRRQVGAAAEPGLGGDDEARVHVHRRHVRIVHVRDQRDARGPEARIALGAGNFLAEFGRELAVHGRDSARRPSRTPGRASSPSRRRRRAAPVWSVRSHGVRTKRPAARSDSGAPAAAPPPTASNAAQMSSRSCSNQARARALAGFQRRRVGEGRGHGGRSLRSSCRRNAVRLPHRLAERHGGGHRHIERAQTGPHRDDQPGVGRRVHGLRHPGRFAAEQQDVVGAVGVVEIAAVCARW